MYEWAVLKCVVYVARTDIVSDAHGKRFNLDVIWLEFICGSQYSKGKVEVVLENRYPKYPKMTAVGFEPTPLRTGAWSQRLILLGQTVDDTCSTLWRDAQIQLNESLAGWCQRNKVFRCFWCFWNFLGFWVFRVFQGFRCAIFKYVSSTVWPNGLRRLIQILGMGRLTPPPRMLTPPLGG